QFVNGVELNSKKSIWVKWSNVLSSKEKGGLGVSSLYALNRALMFKWVWRFTTQQDLIWTRVIKDIYGEDGRIGDGSKHLYEEKVRQWCGDLFWDDVWCGESALKHIFPRLYALEVNKEIDVASKLLQENIWSSFRRTPRSGLETEQLELLEFSVSSIRKAIDDYTLPNVSSQTRWIKEVPIKVNIHAWKVRLDCLPTCLKLSCRSLDIPSIICPICGRGVESPAHLFFVCDLAKDNFRKICRWWNVEFIEIRSFDEWASWVGNLRMPIKHMRLLEGVCFGLWWLIWSFRNKKVFGVDSPSKAAIFDDIVLFSFYWSRYRSKVSFSWVDWLKNPHLVSL
nr:RNA-directed DNA polymerase, eukaryota, reverse transcriptase zinc-binding domain protein [Tanacetum cinerariifolium]